MFGKGPKRRPACRATNSNRTTLDPVSAIIAPSILCPRLWTLPKCRANGSARDAANESPNITSGPALASTVARKTVCCGATARHFALSYFDHPPLSFWIAAAIMKLTGALHMFVF